MKTVFTLAAIAVFGLASAQKTQNLNDFYSLTVGSDISITLIKSNENKLVANGEGLEVDNSGGVLALKGEGQNVTVYYKTTLQNIAAASDAKIYGKDEISGAGMNISAASDAKIELNISVRKLNTAANSDAVITLTGKADKHNVTLASDAKFNGKALVTRDTAIVMSSDASAEIYATGDVAATVSSDGSLKIFGKPKKIDKVTGSDASIVMAD